MLERENIDNFIADDLALRNRNWGQIEAELAEKADKQQGAWEELTLLEGWSGSLKYRINSIGELEVYGNSLIAGTASLNTLISTLPIGSRPLSRMLPITCHDGSTGDVVFLMARTNGSIILGNGFSTGRTYQVSHTSSLREV